MRKSFTRLLGVFILFCMMALQAVAQPVIATNGLKPVDGACQVARQGVFVITFNEDVSPGYNGTISLNNRMATEYIPIQLRSAYETSAGSGVFNAPAGALAPWKVTFSGKTVTVDFGYKLAEYTKYYITVSPTAVKSKANPANFFAGINGSALADLKCNDDVNAGWDFTSADETAPFAATLVPADEAKNIAQSTTCTVTFNENVVWVGGTTGANTTLKVGDIAIYDCTDTGIYGGDVIYGQPLSAVITGNQLVITWPGLLPTTTDVYVRINPKIIEDERGNDFAGFNTNGMPYGTAYTTPAGAGVPWNFTTKDGTVPTVAFALTSCLADANITITLNEIGIVKAITRSSLSSIIGSYVSLTSGGTAVPFAATIAESGSSTIITVNPTPSLTSGGSYVVTLLDGLWDSSDNPIPTKSATLTAGDYTAPSLTKSEWKNPDGTTFNLNLISNEAATYYYIVVKADDIKKDASPYYYQPENGTAPNTVQSKIVSIVTAIGATPGVTTTYTWLGATGVTDDKTITVYAAGDIVAPAGVELLEHVTLLPESHGTDWVVLLFGADNSTCGNSNHTGITTTKNVSGLTYILPSTYDIMPPVPTITATLVDPSDEADGCSELAGTDTDTNDAPNGIYRNGPVYITFNEDVEDDDGSAFTSNEIAQAVTLNDGSVVLVDTAYYEAAKKRFVIFPARPFASGGTLVVTLQSNVLQDAKDELRFGPNGTELLAPATESFCIETYRGPILTVKPCASTLGFDRAGEITLSVKKAVYAPTIDGGGLISSDSANVAFVGKYIQMRKHPAGEPDLATLNSGEIIYDGNANPKDSYFLSRVSFSVAYQGDSVVIKITPKSGFEWESETWYSIELERSIRTVDLLDLTEEALSTEGNVCANDNYWSTFRSEDSRDPVLIFYEDNNFSVNGLGTVEPLLCNNLDVQAAANILVAVDEWVELGFGQDLGVTTLQPSDKIDDANALRRYFSLFDVTKADSITRIPFDVKTFTLSASGDIAQFYIDPYRPSGDNPNFVIGHNYQVCFIDNPNEVNAWADYTPGDALVDDAGNPVHVVCCNFTCPVAPVAPTCLLSATIENVLLNSVTSTLTPVTNVPVNTDSIVNLTLNFGIVLNNPLLWTGSISIIDTLTGVTVQSADLTTGVLSSPGTSVSFEFDMHDAVTGTSKWRDIRGYAIQFSGLNVINGLTTSCPFPSVIRPFNPIHTIDGSAPVITQFIPDVPGTPGVIGGCLTDKDETDIIIVFDENVTKQAGKFLEIWRLSTNSVIRAIDAALANDAKGDTVIISKNIFAASLAYDESYYIHIPQGFVKNAVGLENAGITLDDSLTFCVGPDPAPRFVCGSFDPEDGSTIAAQTPNLTITFSEAVVPVANKAIQIFRTGQDDPTTAFLVASATSFTKADADGKKWRLATLPFFTNHNGTVFDKFEWDSCFDVNIAGGAFREVSGANQVTDTLITHEFPTAVMDNDPLCNWSFCIGDVTAPTVKFWPEDKEVHVATNAHLYAYISEFPVMHDGTPINAQNAADYFDVQLNGTSIDFDVEFVGNDIPGGDNQKQRIRIVPRDSQGPDWSSTSTTPSMQPDTLYTLSFVNPTGLATTLEDINGNAVVEGSVTFRTEDIVKPIFDVAPSISVAPTSNKVTITGSLNEAGKVRWLLLPNNGTFSSDLSYNNPIWASTYTSLGLARGEVATSGAASDFTITATLDPDPKSGYDYDLVVFGADDEVDFFATDAQILAEWPFKMNPEFETEVYRIKDLRPAPNRTVISDTIDITFCDNDAPVLLGTYPARSPKNMSFPVEDSIMLWFNEPIQINDLNVTGNKIVLRDANNNLGVPLAFDISKGDTLILYPLDSAFVGNEADAFIPYTTGLPRLNLDEQRDYYLEIDRWAISDDAAGACTSSGNYWHEWVGKDSLQFRTEDNTPPCLVSWMPKACVEPEADIVLTFNEGNDMNINSAITGDSAYIYIYREGQVTPHERLPISWAQKTKKANGQYQFTIPTSYSYLSGESYRVRVPGNLFKDSYNNVWFGDTCLCASPAKRGFEWTFDVRDYEDPIAEWVLIQDFTYLNVAYDDPEYIGKIDTLQAGATATDVPTSSLLKIKFNEDVYLLDKDVTPNAWKLMNDPSVLDELAAAIHLKDVTNGKELFYDPNGIIVPTTDTAWVFAETLGTDNLVIRVFQAQEHWTPAMTTPFIKDAGFKSNTTYTIALDAGLFADSEDCDNTRNIYDALPTPLGTFITRDDTPPSLTITDSKGNEICGGYCANEVGPIKLSFNNPVVKTPFSGIDYDALIWDSEDVNWWTYSNLPLLPVDLMDTQNGDFLNFFYLGATPTGIGTPVTLSGVTIDPNGKDILVYPNANLVSEGYYKIVFKGGSVKDQKRIPDGNEFLGDTCIFRVQDWKKPYALGFYPADNANGISNILTGTTSIPYTVGGTAYTATVTVGADSVAILFNEQIAKGSTTADLILRRMNGQIIDEVSIEACKVDQTNNNVLVIPIDSLEEFTAYYVEVPAGFVTDADTLGCTPNESIAIDPELVQFGWDFATADATPPVAIAYIPNDTDTVSRNSDLTIIFDENIFPSTSTDCELYIYHHDNVVGWVGNPDVDFGNVVEVIEFNLGGAPNYEISGSNIYNQLDKNIITFNPVNDFTRIGTYYIRVDGNCIADGQGNNWVGVHDSTTWRFTVTNDVAPILNTTDPEYDHATAPWVYTELPADPHGYVVADLSMTFVDEFNKQPLLVAPGEGSIKIYEYRYNAVTFKAEEKLWKEYDINDEAVVFDNDKVTINDVLLRDCINKQFGIYEECYYVYVDRGAVTNGYPGSKTFWAGIDNAFVWRFQTGCDDTFVCEAEILSPNKKEGTEDGLNLTIEDAGTLIATFGEGIEAMPGAEGKIQISDEEGLVAEIAVVDSMCEGNTLTVDISAFLEDEKNYSIVVQAGAFGDTSTVSTGIDATCLGPWEFQTGDNTTPAPESITFEGEDCVEASPVLVLTFDETSGVVQGTGSILIADTLGTQIAEIAIENVVFDVNTVTIDLDGIVLPDTTVIEVTVPAGFMFDGDITPLANEEFSWTFKTGENTVPTVEAITPENAITADTLLAITFSEVVNTVAGKVITINEVEVYVDSMATEDNITYTYPLTDLVSEATYAVVIEEGAFVDVNEDCTPNNIAETALSFLVDDISAPIATGSPTTATDYVGLSLEINFTDAVTPATGNVVIYDAETDTIVETIPATEFTAASDNSVYTYAPENVRFGEYYILIDSGAFVDNAAAEVGKACPGIQDKEGWPLSIVDGVFITCWNIIAPQRADRDVPVATTIVIDFCDERIKPGSKADRFLTVGDQSEERIEGVNYFNYLITDDMIEGNKLSVDVEGLSENTTYSIIIAPGAITDEAGNEFIGITDANMWIFTTGDFSVPEVTVDAVTVINVEGNSVDITSSELGLVYLAKEDVPANAAALLAAISQDKAVVATVTTAGTAVTVSVEGLEPGTYKAYGIDESGSIGVATNVVTVEEEPVMDFTAISVIQGSADASPLDGTKVRTKGVVTAIDKNGFYLQDAVAAWSGVYVYSTQFVGDVSIGGSYEVIGTVDEYNGLTEIVDVETLVPMIKILTVTPIEVAASEAVAEKYEGVLVKVIGRATSSYTGSADWAVKTASNITIAVSNYIYGEYSSILDHNYAVIGVVYQRNADYKVEPRIFGDITDLSDLNGIDSDATSMKVYPNPFDKYISLNVSSNVQITKAVITNIAGQLVKEVINPNNTIPTSELRSGVYFISLHTVDGIAKTERIIKR